MAIKVFSDKTNKYYNSVAEAEKAEFELKEQENRDKILAERKAAELKEKREKEAAERKEMANAVEDARKAMVAAQKVYKEKLEAFCKKYHSYHYSSTSIDDIPTLFDSIFSWF